LPSFSNAESFPREKESVPMSGHNKWSTIKHKKGAADAKRGRLFTKIIKEMTVAAKNGGGDPESNPRLRAAVLAAKSANMPADNIKRAIQRGTGELDGVSYEELTYEGYGPGGVAVLVESMTDNKNRTVAEIRHIFSKYGGALGETGSVRRLFEKKGYISVEKSAVGEDALMETALEAGADDMQTGEDAYEIYTAPDAFEGVRSALEAKKIPMQSAEVSMIPTMEVALDGSKAAQMIKMMDAFEDHDDVQNVWANFDIDDADMA
jgi:YebC/PmpR family DNA-binding regulatory protein